MNHVVIMKKRWELIPKILSGKKTIESRWYKNKVAPWNRISFGDTLYFKDSGDLVKVKAVVDGVEQIEISDDEYALKIIKERSLADLGTIDIPEDVLHYISGKMYAIFVSFRDVEVIQSFDIDKKGFGMQSAWLVCEDVDLLKK
ncbi:hypothetical protein CO058_00285 [candidate division WWE3 bacterium CG_4_9_14_0_2_um_filter_35_11]|uniref:ASCH domain-containing protein n=1 Tax=candidate division WWE3 bacterium CG_4_9_14_0_2_um_filter_35_11 TaxID=1975077 RepID=A0A2M8EMT7_UNCKA|nr:MAG: hypothetical protein COV25_00245 [candidate division WWE3 bacterium CG10_big_fil_rev_8_21_14_0_10_35_32]PJC24053.1 MAG: hypothetical protein CO058_00285 [candidate division WWE3 bacterium CG_4_9_14_0_2_um_filter_35_11]